MRDELAVTLHIMVKTHQGAPAAVAAPTMAIHPTTDPRRNDVLKKCGFLVESGGLRGQEGHWRAGGCTIVCEHAGCHHQFGQVCGGLDLVKLLSGSQQSAQGR